MSQCNDYNTCSNGLFNIGDNCAWVVLLVGAYFFLSNGCVGNIFGKCDNSIIWIILLFCVLFAFNQNNCYDHPCC